MWPTDWFPRVGRSVGSVLYVTRAGAGSVLAPETWPCSVGPHTRAGVAAPTATLGSTHLYIDNTKHLVVWCFF